MINVNKENAIAAAAGAGVTAVVTLLSVWGNKKLNKRSERKRKEDFDAYKAKCAAENNQG